MSWLSQLLHPSGGYDKAQEAMNQYYNQSQGYLNPFIQGGQQAFNPTFSAMNQLLDPAALQNKWIQSYQESPAAKQAQGLAKEQGLDAASAMGLMGSSTALNALQHGASDISLADRQNYLNDLMQKYQLGTGIGQNLYNTGAGAAGQAAGNAMNMGQQSAQNAFNRYNAPGQLIGQGAGMIGKTLMDYLTGAFGHGGMGRGILG